MKRILVVTVLLVTCLLFAPNGANALGSKELLTKDFWMMAQEQPSWPNILSDLTYADGYFYMRFSMDGSFFRLNPRDAQIERLTTLSIMPPWGKEWDHTDISQLSVIEQEAVRDYVNYFLTDGSKLYAINLYTGNVGVLSDTELVWGSGKIDTAPFSKKGTMLLQGGITSGFVEDGSIYALGDFHPDIVKSGSAVYKLSPNGEAIHFYDASDATLFCRYKPGKALLAARKDKKTALYTLDLATGLKEPLSFTLPFEENSYEGSAGIGGLAYDAETDLILFSANKRLWMADSLGSCVPFAELPNGISVFSSTPGWIIGNRTYAIFVEDILYVRAY